MLTGDSMGGATTHLLLTSHKGVDLHAATARRVMQDRLSGGDRLADLRRCAFHVFGGAVPADAASVPTLAALLATGRFFNPNKHHYGHFELPAGFAWDEGRGEAPPVGWPGRAVANDRGPSTDGLWDELLGGAAPAACTAVDVAAWARGQDGGVVSGSLWRLVVRGKGPEAVAVGRSLALARGGREGLLVNPHMECWLVAAAGEAR